MGTYAGLPAWSPGAPTYYLQNSDLDYFFNIWNAGVTWNKWVQLTVPGNAGYDARFVACYAWAKQAGLVSLPPAAAAGGNQGSGTGQHGESLPRDTYVAPFPGPTQA